MIVDGIVGGKKDKEEFADVQSADAYVGETEILILNILYWTISILLGLVAFWLSWSCNTALGYNVALKAVFGTLSFLFGMTYILLFIIFRWDVCSGRLKIRAKR